MAFTLVIEKHPEALNIIKEFIASAKKEGRIISQHQAVILSIVTAKTNKELLEHERYKNQTLQAEVKRLKEIEAATTNFKKIMQSL
jgi:16S rRNA G966 N2-methylase RsmD